MSSLRTWIDRLGKRMGERQRLHKLTGVSLPAIDRACRRRATLEVAEKLSTATGGEVEVWRMTRARSRPRTKQDAA